MTIPFGRAISRVAPWNLPNVFPDRYEYSLYELPPRLLETTAIGANVSAVLP